MRPLYRRGLAVVLLSLAAMAGTPAIGATRAEIERDLALVRQTMLADPSLAVKHAQDAEKTAATLADPRERDIQVATARWLLGEAYIRIDRTDLAKKPLDNALLTVSRLAPSSNLEGELLLSAGTLESSTGKISAAMAHLQRAHSTFQRLGETRNQAKALIQLAAMYGWGNDHESALRYFEQATQVYKADPGLAIAIYNGRGAALNELDRRADAVREFGKAIAIARNMGSPLLTATILNNLARTELAAGRTGEAESAIRESLKLTGDAAEPAFRAQQRSLQAQAAFERGALNHAERLSRESFVVDDTANPVRADREAHQTAYEIYNALGDSEKALAHLDAWKKLDDEATEIARSNGAALAAARFDFANQELRIAQLKAADLQKTVAFERANAQTQRATFIGIVAGTVIVIAMLAFGLMAIRRSRDQVHDANVDLERSNVALGKALAAKTEFLATTSHEIRTPLNGILGMTQVMLADANLDDEVRDRLKIVQGAGVTMRDLVSDILDVAKMETGKLEIERVRFDLSATVEEAARLWIEPAKAKGLTFGMDLAALPQWVIADPARLRQIVFNILSNAVKFTSAGAIMMRAEVAGGRYRLIVSDTGIGIAPDKHEEIFEAFRQADSATTRNYGGTGLGLSICRNLSRAMGGDVTVVSEEAEGATFTLDLPLVLAPSQDQTAELAVAAGTGILIVERNPIARATLKTVLQSRGSAVEAVGALEDATTAKHAAVIVVDRAALGEDDEVAAAALRDTAPRARIILLSVTDTAERAEAFRSAGIDTVVFRPIGKDALLRLVCDAELDHPPLVSQAA